MHYNLVYRDVSTIYGWYKEGFKPAMYGTAMRQIKTQLTIAALREPDAEFHRAVLEADKWREICWYPGCHGPLEEKRGYVKPYKMHIFARINPKAKLRLEPPNDYHSYTLSCSVSAYSNFPLTGKPALNDYHCSMGICRRLLNTEPIDKRENGQWRKFATTELATYWFWGLKPTETDVYKFADRDVK